MAADAQVGQHDIEYPAVAIEQVSGPPHTDAERAIHVVGPITALSTSGEQREGQGVAVAEPPVAGGILRADADDLQSGARDLRMQIAEVTGLGGTARGEIGG